MPIGNNSSYREYEYCGDKKICVITHISKNKSAKQKVHSILCIRLYLTNYPYAPRAHCMVNSKTFCGDTRLLKPLVTFKQNSDLFDKPDVISTKQLPIQILSRWKLANFVQKIEEKLRFKLHSSLEKQVQFTQLPRSLYTKHKPFDRYYNWRKGRRWAKIY